MMTVNVGSKVKVVSTNEMCCGVLMQGHTDTVDCLMNAFNPNTKKESQVAILRNGSLHWVEELERV